MRQKIYYFQLLKTETLIEQTHGKAKETLDFKMIEPRETFHFNPPVLVEGSWTMGFKGFGSLQ